MNNLRSAYYSMTEQMLHEEIHSPMEDTDMKYEICGWRWTQMNWISRVGSTKIKLLLKTGTEENQIWTIK